MSIHCLICGHQDNWRDNNKEVMVDNKTWVIIRIFRDNLLGEKTKTKRAIEQWWAHRDCVQELLEQYGVETKLNYEPKSVGR